MIYKGYIFDLDGTVLDSMGVWHDVDVEFLGKRNLPFTEEYGRAISHMKLEIAAEYTVKLYRLNEDPKDIIKENGIFEYFDAFSDAEAVTKGKDSPEIFLIAARALRLKPEDCIVFEDTAQAVKTAKKAGFTVAAMEDKENEEIKETADFVIRDFESFYMELQSAAVIGAIKK